MDLEAAVSDRLDRRILIPLRIHRQQLAHDLAPVRRPRDHVARARHLPEAKVSELIASHTQGRTLGVLGEPRVNVVLLNLALDALK